MKMRIRMPSFESYFQSGIQDIELPVVPRIGETIQGASGNLYKVLGVIYQPWSAPGHPRIEIELGIAPYKLFEKKT